MQWYRRVLNGSFERRALQACGAGGATAGLLAALRFLAVSARSAAVFIAVESRGLAKWKVLELLSLAFAS